MPRSENVDLVGKLDVSKIQPYGDHVLLEVIERNVSLAGLILPDKEKTECLYGKVLAVGPGEYSPRTGQVHPMGVKVGDYIMSVQYMGEKVTTLGKKYRLLREHGIWAKLKIAFKSETDWEITEAEPYMDHILIKMDLEEKSLKGKVFLPANPQTMFRCATHIKAGPGKRNQMTGIVSPLGLAPGDRLIVLRYAGCIMRINGVEHRMASGDDVEGIITSGAVDVLADTHMSRPVDDYDVIPDQEFVELNKKTIMDSGGKV